MEYVAYVAWVFVCTAAGTMYGRRQSRHRTDIKETGAAYALMGALVGASFGLGVLVLSWLVT